MLVVLSLAVGVVLWLVYHRTQLGAVIRAGVDDREMVGAIGINVDRLFIMVSALASFLAGMAGVVGGAFLTLYPGAEWEILVFALVVVIFGGLGSLEGAMIGALIVGLLDAYGRWLLPEFSYFVLFGPMAVLLLFRPTGLFGKAH
jgi:branched-chain amino acid transport system permease protein